MLQARKKTNKAGSSWDMQPWKLPKTSLDLLPTRREEGRVPCSSQEGQRWALSDVMCPGWLVLCLIYVWGQWQSLTHSPSPSNLNVHSKGLFLPAARPCPLSVCRSVCLFLTNLTSLPVCLCVFLPLFYLLLASVYMPVWLFVGQALACLLESLPSLALYGCMNSYEPLTMPWKCNHPAQLDVCLCVYTQMCIQERKQPAMYTNKRSPTQLW